MWIDGGSILSPSMGDVHDGEGSSDGRQVASTETNEMQAHATSKYFPVGALPEFSSVGQTAKERVMNRRGDHTMHTHTLTSICGGLILAGLATVIGS